MTQPDIYAVYLNNIRIGSDEEGNDWINWKSFDRQIIRNDEAKMYAVQTTSSFEFTGQGYELLVDAVKTLGRTASIPASITYRKDASSALIILSGIICLTSVTYPLKESGVACIATCKIEGNAMSQYILNNRDVAFFIGQGKSLLNASVTPSVPLQLQMFDPVDNTNIVGSIKAYDVKDCFTEIFASLSESAISFESGWYDSLGDEERYVITTGLNLRQVGEEDPQISLQTLFDDFQKKYNLWLFTEVLDDGTYVVKLEEESFLTQTDSIRLNGVRGVVTSTDEARMYSNIKVGSNTYIKDQNNTYTLPTIPLLTHVSENYTIITPCNSGTTLDLVSNLIIDSNSIQDALPPFDNDDNDEELFIIQYTLATTRATTSTITTPAAPTVAYQYNGALLNYLVTDRWRVQGDIANNFVVSIDRFKVGTTQISTIRTGSSYWLPAELDDDTSGTFFNDNNVWDTTNFQFICQATGMYRFSGEMFVEYIANADSDTVIETAEVGLYTASDNLIGFPTILLGNTPFIPAAPFISSVAFLVRPMYIQKGQRLKFLPRVIKSTNGAGLQYRFRLDNTFGTLSYFELIDEVVTSDLLTDTDPNAYFSEVLTFSHPYASELWLELEKNPTRRIDLYIDEDATGPYATGWAQSIKTDFSTGVTEWELITNPLGEPFS